MDIFSVITLLGGLTFFLYGMNVMSQGLEKMTGGKLESLLKKMTSNPFKSLLLGAGVTIAIQSSSAMTVMLVGLVNSGIMQLNQTISIIMGSNIGTTLTAWILSLAGIETTNVWMRLLKPENFSLIIAFIGIIMIMVSSDTRKKDIGSIFVGFAVLMFGMELMADAVSPLADSPAFSSILTAFKNPFMGILVGTVFTGIIQSSAASVGILQALSLTGGITYGMAIPIIMGQNIGTCVTAILSSICVNRNAKRVAVIHISFNIIGTAVCMALFFTLNSFIHFAIMDCTINPVGIAASHSVFNIFTTLLLLPFPKQLEKIAYLVVKDTDKKEKYSFIDERLLNTPSVAVSECRSRAIDMCNITKTTLKQAINLIEKYSEKDFTKVNENEDALDKYEDKIGTYLVQLSSKDISDEDSKTISKMLHVIGYFERLGDYASDIGKIAKEMHDKNMKFSDEAIRELRVIESAVSEILSITQKAFTENNLETAAEVEPLEHVINYLNNTISVNHIKRLRNKECTIEMGLILAELLKCYERISDYCSNIAVTVIEVERLSFNTHKYLNNVEMIDERFKDNFNEFSLKYKL